MTEKPDYFTNITELEERLCRAICVAEGVNSDQEATGMGGLMPDGMKYPLWMARLRVARAADATARAAYDADAADAAYAAYDAVHAVHAAVHAADAEREWQSNRLLQYLNGEV